MNKETADKQVTITLTDERPVKVKNGLWPVVAKASHDKDHNNQEIFRRHYLRVRQHADGRCLVYGWYESSYQDEAGAQAGYRCQIEDVVETIRKVGAYIEAPQWLIDECVSDLPAVEEDADYPLTLNIAIKIADKAQAEAVAENLIEWEGALRGGPGDQRFIPVTPKTKLADSIKSARRSLQEIAGLVVVPSV